MAKVIGLVNLHSDIEFTGLTERRPVASVSFLGRYGIIDFVLSNMSNSKIDAIGVMIQKKPRSLFKHLEMVILGTLTKKLVVFHYFIMKNMLTILNTIMILTT